jgi:hypothetical protein
VVQVSGNAVDAHINNKKYNRKGNVLMHIAFFMDGNTSVLFKK